MDGGIQQGLFSLQLQKLFGELKSGEGPEASAAAASQDDGGCWAIDYSHFGWHLAVNLGFSPHFHISGGRGG